MKCTWLELHWKSNRKILRKLHLRDPNTETIWKEQKMIEKFSTMKPVTKYERRTVPRTSFGPKCLHIFGFGPVVQMGVGGPPPFWPRIPRPLYLQWKTPKIFTCGALRWSRAPKGYGAGHQRVKGDHLNHCFEHTLLGPSHDWSVKLCQDPDIHFRIRRGKNARKLTLIYI